jgi:RHS repeat-associated protein
MSRTYFFWDPLSDNILQERDESGTVTAEYTTEPGLYGNLISQNRGGVERQYHFDPQGSTLALTDDNQQVTDTYAYSAFGEVTERHGSTINPFQYVGQKQYYRDEETEVYDVRRRTYSAGSGQWLTQDPLGRIVVRYGYVYCGNRPLIAVDPTGLAEVFFQPQSAVGIGWYDFSFIPSFPFDAVAGATIMHTSVSCTCQQYGRRRRTWCSIGCTISTKFKLGLNRAIIDCLNARNLSSLTPEELKRCIEWRKELAAESVPLPTLEGTYGHEQRHIQSMMDRIEELGRRLGSEEQLLNQYGSCCGCVQSADDLAFATAKWICLLIDREAHPPHRFDESPSPSPVSGSELSPLKGVFPVTSIGGTAAFAAGGGPDVVSVNGKPFSCNAKPPEEPSPSPSGPIIKPPTHPPAPEP